MVMKEHVMLDVFLIDVLAFKKSRLGFGLFIR